MILGNLMWTYLLAWFSLREPGTMHFSDMSSKQLETTDTTNYN